MKNIIHFCVLCSHAFVFSWLASAVIVFLLQSITNSQIHINQGRILFIELSLNSKLIKIDVTLIITYEVTFICRQKQKKLP